MLISVWMCTHLCTQIIHKNLIAGMFELRGARQQDHVTHAQRKLGLLHSCYYATTYTESNIIKSIPISFTKHVSHSLILNVSYVLSESKDAGWLVQHFIL